MSLDELGRVMPRQCTACGSYNILAEVRVNSLPRVVCRTCGVTTFLTVDGRVCDHEIRCHDGACETCDADFDDLELAAERLVYKTGRRAPVGYVK